MSQFSTGRILCEHVLLCVEHWICRYGWKNEIYPEENLKTLWFSGKFLIVFSLILRRSQTFVMCIRGKHVPELNPNMCHHLHHLQVQLLLVLINGTNILKLLLFLLFSGLNYIHTSLSLSLSPHRVPVCPSALLFGFNSVSFYLSTRRKGSST